MFAETRRRHRPAKAETKCAQALPTEADFHLFPSALQDYLTTETQTQNETTMSITKFDMFFKAVTKSVQNDAGTHGTNKPLADALSKSTETIGSRTSHVATYLSWKQKTHE